MYCFYISIFLKLWIVEGKMGEIYCWISLLLLLFSSKFIDAVDLNIFCYFYTLLQYFEGELFSQLLLFLFLLQSPLFLQTQFYHFLFEGLCIFFQPFLGIQCNFRRMVKQIIFLFVEQRCITINSRFSLRLSHPDVNFLPTLISCLFKK